MTEENYYPWWRLDENISWFNVRMYILQVITKLDFKKNKRKFWLPPKIER